MRRNVVILLLLLILSGCLLFAGRACGRHVPETEGGKATAWWTLLYERPNPERLPVKVKFWLASN